MEVTVRPEMLKLQKVAVEKKLPVADKKSNRQ
jgi:hypothetical protein